ncbi:hypothetical protein FQR65_LT13876 [Abscondita terminalis]|nr:hypothetical protein FQR65_LT13876 [Abscondita terminalis]
MFFKVRSTTKAKWRQLAAPVFLGPITFGVSLCWTSPVLPQLQNNNDTLPINLTVSEGSWVGSIIAIGVILAAIPAGFLSDRFGPKKCLVFLVIPTLIFTVMVVFADNAYMLYAGRFLSGITAGGFSALAPLYLGESAYVSRRGIVMSFFEFLIYCGVFLVSLIGAYLHYITLTVIFGVVALVLASGFWFFPESPMYLLRMNRRDEAIKALKFFRSDDFNIDEAIEDMKSNYELQEKLNVKETMMSKAGVRSLVACVGLTAFQQLTGIDCVTFYNVQIWQAADTGMDPYDSANILSTIIFISHAAIVLFAEKAPRRILLYISSAISGLSMLAIGIYFHLKEYDYTFVGMKYLPMASLSLFLIGFSIGLSSVPWMITGELFPPKIKGVAGGIITVVHWVLLFFNVKAFPIVMESYGPQYPFYFFAICMVLCIVFIIFYVPETRGKTLEQIQKELNA